MYECFYQELENGVNIDSKNIQHRLKKKTVDITFLWYLNVIIDQERTTDPFDIHVNTDNRDVVAHIISSYDKYQPQ